MEKINILNKQGFLTDEDRRQPLVRGYEYFTFKSCIDLSQGIEVIPYGSRSEFTVGQYSNDLAAFIGWWSHFVMKDLNGFGGFCNIKFTLVGFTLTN